MVNGPNAFASTASGIYFGDSELIAQNLIDSKNIDDGSPLVIDADVIDGSAERQTVYLRTFQTGPDAELAERLLNEVAAHKGFGGLVCYQPIIGPWYNRDSAMR